MTRNRRQFSRIRFQTDARLYLPHAEYEVAVVDLSLRGALVQLPADAYATVGSNCTLKLKLDETGTTIRMEATIVHRQGNLTGLYCREIDLDSVTHLRRLVELNVGDETILERELHRLSAG